MLNVSSDVVLTRILARSRLRQWQLVQEIAALGSLQRAADAVGLSQPAATHAVAELERLLGCPLFERHAKGARLTPAGEALIGKVRSALHAFRECAEVLSDVLAGSSAELRIGAIGAAINGVLGVAVAAFSSSHPGVAVHVLPLPADELPSELHEAVIDVALLRRPRQLPTDTVFEELSADRYAIVCSPRHELAGREGVPREQLARQLWLTPPKSTVAERDFEWFWAGVAAPRELCWVESRDTVLMWSLVEQRQALAWIPYNLAQPWLRGGVLAEVVGRWGPALEPIGMLYHAAAAAPRGPLADLLTTLRGCRDRARGAAAS